MNFKKILTSAKTIAIIGCSAETNRTSFSISRQLQRKGYEIVPVNPFYDTILGETCYDSMTSIPDDIKIDIAVIFRNKAYTKQMVDSIVERSKTTGQKPIIWTQLDVSSSEAENVAAENGLSYVANRCIAVEYAKHMD
ncbi:MAG: CoA-binding protein [Balneolales bacterium]